MAAAGAILARDNFKDERNVKKRLKKGRRTPVIITNVHLCNIIKSVYKFGFCE